MLDNRQLESRNGTDAFIEDRVSDRTSTDLSAAPYRPPLRAWARKKLNLYSSSKNELVNTTGEMFFQRLCAETPGHRDAQNRDRAVQAPLTKAAIDLRANISRNSHRRKKHIDSKNKRH
jgi:hypothetical protein